MSRPWRIHFFRRHPKDDPAASIPGREFLNDCPVGVRAKIVAVLDAVASAPPPSFSGGGYWEAMHGDMAGFHEVRVDGPQRRHFRLFCLLERSGAELGLEGPSIVIIAGLSKAFRTELGKANYRRVLQLTDEYRSRTPRSVA